MTEADFQTKFSRWAKYHISKTCLWELKLSKSSSIPFSALAEHQERALTQATRSCISYKIPDGTLGQKPTDGFTICNSEAYVVIQFYKPGNKEFFMIPINRWLLEKAASKRRSLTEERAREISIAYELA